VLDHAAAAACGGSRLIRRQDAAGFISWLLFHSYWFISWLLFHRSSVVWEIPNSYLIRYIMNTHLNRHRLGVD
jgi:hypothetical protein